MRTYKAVIHFDSYEDDYELGEIGRGTWWEVTVTAKTKEELKAKIAEETYCDWAKGEIEVNEFFEAGNNVDDHSYVAGYLANESNEGEATPAEIELWKQRKLRLWGVNCQIYVTEVIERKVLL